MSSHHSNEPTRVPIPLSRAPSRVQPSRARSQQTGPERRDANCIRTSRPSSQAAVADVLPEPPTQVEVPAVVSPVAQRTTSRRSIPGGPSFEFTQVTIKTVQDVDNPVPIQSTAGPGVTVAQLYLNQVRTHRRICQSRPPSPLNQPSLPLPQYHNHDNTIVQQASTSLLHQFASRGTRQ